jgi:hypothetical protein
MYGGAQNSKLCELDFLVSTDTGMVTNTEAHTKEENPWETGHMYRGFGFRTYGCSSSISISLVCWKKLLIPHSEPRQRLAARVKVNLLLSIWCIVMPKLSLQLDNKDCWDHWSPASCAILQNLQVFVSHSNISHSELNMSKLNKFICRSHKAVVS